MVRFLCRVLSTVVMQKLLQLNMHSFREAAKDTDIVECVILKNSHFTQFSYNTGKAFEQSLQQIGGIGTHLFMH
jgi:hypothetical protein